MAEAERSLSTGNTLWATLTNAWGDNHSVVTRLRARKDRAPGDHWLFVNGLAGLTSFMAARGILELGEGNRRYIEEARDYFGQLPGRTLSDYVRRKALEKGLRYNTIATRLPTREEKDQIRRDADLYRKARDGE